MDNPQKQAKTIKKPFCDPAAITDPLAALDPLSRRILEIEIANGGISARLIREIGNLDCTIDTINLRRRSPVYQRLLYESQRNAIELLQEHQAKAIRLLVSQLEHSNPVIAQRAALFLAASAKDIQIKRAQMELELELQEREINRPPVKTEVEVIFPGGMYCITDPPINTDAIQIPDQTKS
jgi:hypothetical protein